MIACPAQSISSCPAQTHQDCRNQVDQLVDRSSAPVVSEQLVACHAQHRQVSMQCTWLMFWVFLRYRLIRLQYLSTLDWLIRAVESILWVLKCGIVPLRFCESRFCDYRMRHISIHIWLFDDVLNLGLEKARWKRYDHYPREPIHRWSQDDICALIDDSPETRCGTCLETRPDVHVRYSFEC